MRAKHARAGLVALSRFNAMCEESFGLHCCGQSAACRRLVFEELLERAKEKAAKDERRAKRAAEDFAALLRSAKDLDPGAAWEDAKAALAKEPEYKAVRGAQPAVLQAPAALCTC